MDLIHIEDDPRDAMLISRILREKENQPNYVLLSDGAAALEYFAQTQMQVGSKCKLILLDLKLPKVDGFDVLKHLKSNQQTACIPVVIFSASAMPSDIARAYELGANSYLEKPDSYKELKGVVENLRVYWLQHNHIKTI